MRSKAMGAILGEARELVEAGVQEIILVAQHLTDYGRDLKLKDGLATLLDEICQVVPQDRWIRLMYAYPQSITPGVMRAIADHPQICRYLDMPLQHAHPATLRRMRRPPDTTKTAALLQELRATVPDIALRTTFIVGFPGETREEFTELCTSFPRWSSTAPDSSAILRSLAHRRPRLDGQVSDRVKQRRFAEAMALQQEISLGRNRRWINRDLRMLVEGTGTAEDGTPLIAGRSFRDAPEIDGMIWARGTATPGHVR